MIDAAVGVSASSLVKPGEWKTIRCEGDDCHRHQIIFRAHYETDGGIVIQVKCSRCDYMNEVRLKTR